MKRSGLNVMTQLIGLVRPMLGFMLLAIAMGLLGNLCATFITVFGGYAILNVLHPEWSMSLGWLFAAVLLFALVRGFLRYAEQSCNHFIAFKLLALIRDKVFGALRRLCPAKLEGKDKGDLISVITSDIELLEVFYAHTISPICIAFLFCLMMVLFIGCIHTALGVLALSPMQSWALSFPWSPPSAAVTTGFNSAAVQASSPPSCWTACAACRRPSNTGRAGSVWPKWMRRRMLSPRRKRT